MRTRRMLAVGALALAGLSAGCGGDDAASDGGEPSSAATVDAGATLVASVGPGFDISLRTQDGQDVVSAAPGDYTIEVEDLASIHNFHLTGPGVDERTGVSEEGEFTWAVTFESGTYRFVCDPHASTMNGEFEVTG